MQRAYEIVTGVLGLIFIVLPMAIWDALLKMLTGKDSGNFH